MLWLKFADRVKTRLSGFRSTVPALTDPALLKTDSELFVCENINLSYK